MKMVSIFSMNHEGGVKISKGAIMYHKGVVLSALTPRWSENEKEEDIMYLIQTIIVLTDFVDLVGHFVYCMLSEN